MRGGDDLIYDVGMNNGDDTAYYLHKGFRVVAVEAKTGQRYAAQTGITGGYSIKVPPGHYRLELELQEGETIVKEPGDIDINAGDLDPNMDVVVRVR